MTVEVTQADREAAAERLTPVVDAPGRFADSIAATQDRIRSGNYDGHPWVQAFARHRILSTVTAKASVRAEALEALVPDHAAIHRILIRAGRTRLDYLHAIDAALQPLRTALATSTDGGEAL